MTSRLALAMAVWMLLCNQPTGAQSKSGVYIPPKATVVRAAPIVLLPDETRTPLTVAKPGTVLDVRSMEGDWYYVEFEDSQVGRRTGYVKKEFVTVPTAEQRSAAPTENVRTTTSDAPKAEPLPKPTGTTPPKATPPESSAVTHTTTSLSAREVADAIAFGTHWKSAEQFLDEGLKPYHAKIAGVMLTDGTTKYVTVLTDWTAIAAASADAHRRLRQLTSEDISKFPNTGLVQAVVELHARGIVPTHRMQGRYGNGVTHLVFKFGDLIVQPLEQTIISDHRSPAYQLWVFTSDVFGRLGWVFVQPVGGWPEEKIVLNFAFALTDAQRHATGQVVLIDGNGSQDTADIDFRRLR